MEADGFFALPVLRKPNYACNFAGVKFRQPSSQKREEALLTNAPESLRLPKNFDFDLRIAASGLMLGRPR